MKRILKTTASGSRNHVRTYASVKVGVMAQNCTCIMSCPCLSMTARMIICICSVCTVDMDLPSESGSIGRRKHNHQPVLPSFCHVQCTKYFYKGTRHCVHAWTTCLHNSLFMLFNIIIVINLFGHIKCAQVSQYRWHRYGWQSAGTGREAMTLTMNTILTQSWTSSGG